MRFLSLVLSALLAIGAWFDKAQLHASEAGNFNPIIPTSISSETIRSELTPSVRDAYAEIFANNVYHVSQQQGSILMPFVEMMGMVSTAKQITRLGTLSSPSLYTSRGERVVASNPATDVRWVTAQRYWQACHVDSWDELRTLYSIQNAYSEAMSMSFGRLYDRVIIAAALGTVYTGPSRDTAVALPDSQKYVSLDDSGDFAPTGYKDLVKIRTRMKNKFAINKGQMLVYACTANEVANFLMTTEIINRDYTNNLVLASGEVAAFMGFLFAETQLIPEATTDFRHDANNNVVSSGGTSIDVSTTAGKAVRTFCFVTGRSLCFGINMNMFSRVSERADLHYIIQLYYAAEFGAVRKEEVTVIEVLSQGKYS